MHIKKKDLKKGIIQLIPENADDIYLLSLIIKPEDIVYAKTTRRIRRTSQDSVRPDEGRRETFTLGIKVEKVELIGMSEAIRIQGIIVEGPEDKIDLYSHHTLTIVPREQITIQKEKWEKNDLERLEEAVQASKKAPLIIMALDSDEATIALVNNYSTRYVSNFSPSLTRKSSSVNEYEEDIKQFWSYLTNYLLQLKKEYEPDLIVIAGPGFWKNDFIEYAIKRAPELKPIIMDVSASTGSKTGITEVLSRGLPAKVAEERRASYESELVKEVLKRLGKNLGTIAYGWEEVEKAATYGAVEHLLVLDRLFMDPTTREKVEKIIKLVKNSGGKITIMSSLHDTGKTIEGLTGIIALLRFSLN